RLRGVREARGTLLSAALGARCRDAPSLGGNPKSAAWEAASSRGARAAPSPARAASCADCREEQYPCTRLYSVHKPCKQCLNEICFYSLRRVYVINKEICVRTVCKDPTHPEESPSTPTLPKWPSIYPRRIRWSRSWC
uniref:Microfibril associated protein 2 n=1 Tax=Crocodylus porosus TaxID=8502 RepID=A0A7M4FJX9_CROPO